MSYRRYAVYYMPGVVSHWGRLATAWLGWDAETGRAVAHPDAADLADLAHLPMPVDRITERPRRYGLHATIKPPFRLAEGCTQADLMQACATHCAGQSALRLDGLAIAPLGRFLALQPVGDVTALGTLAADTVRALDRFRAPASADELARRRAHGLSPAQEANLARWGYPFVMDAFRFHITLSGPLDTVPQNDVRRALDALIGPHLPVPFEISDLALAGEDDAGRFHLIHRYTLSGASAASA
jgi:putative phosphonate metabolism protein